MFQAGDLTQLATVKQWLGLSGLAIAGISNANPAVVTLAVAPPIPIVSGLSYNIAGVTGTAGIDGAYVVTVKSPTTFSIPVDATANGTYTGGGTVGIADALVERLIHACSAYAQTAMSRQIANQTYVETRDGKGTTSMSMRQQPITSVAGVSIDGIPIPARPALGTTQPVTAVGFGYGLGPFGWVNDDTRVMLSGGGMFGRGYQNIVVTYDAGYLLTEVQSVPADPGPYTIATLGHWSAADRGVIYTLTSLPLTKVSGTPNAGEYAVDGSTYTFAAADTGVSMAISYAFVPSDLEQAVVDMIGDWFRYQSRIGKTSEGIEGQSISFTNTPMPVRARDVIAKYNSVVPV